MRRWVILAVMGVGCAGYGSAFEGATRVAEASCERAFACTSSYPAESEVAFEARFGADEEACVAQVGPDPAREDAWEAAVESGVVAYDVAAAKACVEALEGTGCEALFAEPPAEPCRSVTTGSLALDEACTLDAECESGLCLEERCAGPVDDDDDSEGA